MMSPQPNESEEWFDRYVRDHGNEPGSPEPDLGTSRRPDRVITWAGERVVCEVKEFAQDAVEGTGRPQMIGDTEWYGPVREKVHQGARQMRELSGSGMPLVVVLANPQGMFIPLTTSDVIYALYGNPGYSFKVDPLTGGAVTEPAAFAGRDGEITNDHPYLSGVLVLRHRTKAQDFADDLHRRLASEHGWAHPPKTTDDATRRALIFAEVMDRARERGEIPEGDYLFGDLIVSMSKDATALSPKAVDGPRDSRWEFDARTGVYGDVRAKDEKAGAASST